MKMARSVSAGLTLCLLVSSSCNLTTPIEGDISAPTDIAGDLLAPDEPDVQGMVDLTLPPHTVKPCSEIYDEELLPTYEVEIAPDVWAAMLEEWANGAEWEAEGKPVKVYRPVKWFRYEGETFFDVMIRPKGSPFQWPLSPTKMQFNISFTQINKEQRFRGVRKLLLDAPGWDSTFFHDRLGFSYMRDLGIPASCANSARLLINGEFYGLYTSIERVDKEFLTRWFGPELNDGNLYKYFYKANNEDDGDTSDLEETFLFDGDTGEFTGKSQTIEDLLATVDLDEAVLEWAGEAIMPDGDGFWIGSDNFYLYNHPERGFLFIPWDLDISFDHKKPYVDPISHSVDWGIFGGKPPQFELVMADPVWSQKFRDALDTARSVYDPAVLQDRIDRWSAQIIDSVAEDTNKPFTTQGHIDQVAVLREFVQQRADYYDSWKVCTSEGSPAIDESFEGADFRFLLAACGWEQAEQACIKAGGHLAVPLNEKEQAFLLEKSQELSEGYWWLGANDIEEEGVFVAPDGSPLPYDQWASEQPDGNDSQNCAALSPTESGDWQDKECASPYPAICRLP